MIGLANLAVAGSMALTGSVETARPCPPACATTINLRIAPVGQPTGPARFFLGVFPVEGSQANQSVGGYWTGQGWSISQVPVSFRQGNLAPLSERVVIREGLCALAKNAGATGSFAVFAGYGRDTLAEQIREVESMDAALDGLSGQQADEMRAVVRDFRAQAAKDPRMGDVVAAKDMRERGTLREIGRVTCP